MKKMKQILALLLCLTMAISGPLRVFAEETDAAIEETVTEEEKSSVCEICQQEPCVCVAEEIEKSEETAQVCENCQQEPCVCVSEETAQVCETCQQESCVCNQADAVSEKETTEPQIGDKIWIKHGSYVYKKQTEENGHKLLLNYEVQIVDIITDENGIANWYKFKFTSLGIGEFLLHDYKYVKVENTSIEEPNENEPVDENACNCGENAPENLADHADDCPRKKYVKTLFEGKSAEEIYAQWETYDEATRTDLLNMLQKWDNAKYEELNKLLKCSCGTENGVHSEDCPLYRPVSSDTITTEDGITINVSGMPEGGALQIAEADEVVLNEVKADVESHFAEMNTYRTPNVIEETLFAYDISVIDADQASWQPDGTVEITLTVPELLVSAYEKVYIGHMHNGDVQLLETKLDYEKNTITFIADGFSVFYGFIVDFEYNGYKFSLDGGGEVMLSELMKALEISYDVSEVINVTFSDNSLIEIERKDSDWKLTSLSSFGTDEWLIIYFSDDTDIEIKVTDPVLFYYLNGTNWCMETFNNTIDDKSYVSNTVSITGSNLGKTHEKEGTADVIIYARPGMAIRFDRYSTFSTIEELDPYNNYTSKDGLWRWVSRVDSKPDVDGNSHNIAILSSDISSVKETTFTAKIGDHGDGSGDYVDCEIKIVIVPDAKEPTLLKDALKAEDTPAEIKEMYSIRELPVTLYNYDGQKYKEKYSSGGDFFSFKGVSKGNKVDIASGNLTGAGDANGGGPVMGIFEVELEGEEKLPVMVQGQNVDLFSSQTFDGKEVRNVQFEFVYDTEGYYTYSSNINHAQLSDDQTKVQLYREAMGTTANYALNGSSENYAAGGFYPYSDIRKAADSAGNILDWNTWSERIASGYVKEPAPFGMDLVNSATTVQPYSTVDMHNGLQLAAKFYLPADKKTPTGKEIVYQFTGDDDLWVFIDDQLVLDIGGGHTPVSGSINFTTGKITVEGDYYTIGDPAKKENFETNINFDGDKIHSLKIFYLERYAGVSNCRMRFNIPIVPDGAVLVSKELLNEKNENAFAVKPNEDYTFTVYTAADDNNEVDASDNDFTPLSNTPYTIVGTEEKGTTDEKGNFTLKAGQTAQFEGITHFTEVYVVESKPNDGYIYANPKVSVNGGDLTEYGKKTETVVMPDGTLSFSFVNYMDVSNLTISKDVLDAYQVLNGKTYSFTVDLYKPVKTGENQPEASKTYTFNLANEGSYVIENIPTNMTYTVTETNPTAPPGYKFEAPTYGDGVNADGVNDDTATEWKNVKLTGDNSIVVTNELIALYGNLKISKSGISNLDHHEEDVSNKQEQQSTIYKVSGTSASGIKIDMEVLIVGNNSVTIKNVPIGNYVVEEKESWSWRYTAKEKEKNVTVVHDKTAEAPFINERKKIYWLSGDNYARNLFNGTLIRKETGIDDKY